MNMIPKFLIKIRTVNNTSTKHKLQVYFQAKYSSSEIHPPWVFSLILVQRIPIFETRLSFR